MAPETPPSARHERLSAAAAEFLASDTWADEPETCPNCGIEVPDGKSQCPACGQWLERCGRSCPSCASPRCVGGGRGDR